MQSIKSPVGYTLTRVQIGEEEFALEAEEPVLLAAQSPKKFWVAVLKSASGGIYCYRLECWSMAGARPCIVYVTYFNKMQRAMLMAINDIGTHMSILDENGCMLLFNLEGGIWKENFLYHQDVPDIYDIRSMEWELRLYGEHVLRIDLFNEQKVYYHFKKPSWWSWSSGWQRMKD